jgi:hypothetical protein
MGDHSFFVGGNDDIPHYPKIDGPSASPIGHNQGADGHIFFGC